MFYAFGEKYVGEFKIGEKYGKGILIFGDNHKFEGIIEFY